MEIFETVYEQFELNFQDCFRTVRVEFSGLFSNSPDIIFGAVFRQSETNSRTVCVLFFFVLLQNFDKHVGCVKIVLIHAYGCIDMELMMDVNYMKIYI